MCVLRMVILIVCVVCLIASALRVQRARRRGGVQTYLISLPRDAWKRERFRESMRRSKQHFEYEEWSGVLLRENPAALRWALSRKLGHVSNPALKGNIGSALAHLTLWDHIARQDDTRNFLVLEDNAIVTSKSVGAVRKLTRLRYDMIYLVALRPKGKPTARSDLLQVTHDPRPREPLPNVWLSSYLLRPRGARQLLAYFKTHNFDISTVIVDRAVSRAIQSDPTGRMRVFVVNHSEFFGHVETKADTRRRENV